MPELLWEWKLHSGHRVAATLDSDTGLESVLLGPRIVSRTPRGAKPDGHLVQAPRAATDDAHPDGPAEEPLAVVTFDPMHAICILRTPDGHEVAPTVWPMRARAPRPPPRRALPLGAAFGALAIVALAGAGAYAWHARAGGSHAPVVVHRAPNGLFVAHYPETFAARSPPLPNRMNAVVLEDQDRGETVLVASLPLDTTGRGGTRDPWGVHQRIHAEALATLARADGSYDEGARRDETCRGERGAVVTGRVKTARGEEARVWSCAFAHDDAGYLFMLVQGEHATRESTTRLLGILEATELTHLEAMAPREP